MKRIVLMIVRVIGAIMAIGVILYLFPQLYLTPVVRITMSKNKEPLLYIVPIQRKISDLKEEYKFSSPLSCYNMTFTVPWKLIRSKERVGFSMNFEFGQDKILVVSKPNEESMWKSAFAKDEKLSRSVEDLFAEDSKNMKSDYLSNKLILYSHPHEVNIFTKGRRAVAKYMLLVWKGASLGKSEIGGIYNFEEKNVKGFQYGDPEKVKGLLLSVYDRDDREYSIIFSGKNKTQDEVDFILSSISFSTNR